MGTVDTAIKEIITYINSTYITAETIIEFLQQLRRHYLKKPIVVVIENTQYKHCQTVIKSKGNKRILFLPPYSPNLNDIERLWKFTKMNVLYRKYYKIPEVFHKIIRIFFEQISPKYSRELKTLFAP